MSEKARVALVTGSGKKRVGWFVADALAKAGFDLAVHYRTSKEEAGETVEHLRGQGGQAEAFGADLAREDEAEALVSRVVERFGRIDLAVNCAAIWSPKRLEAVKADDLRRYFDVNVLGTFLVGRSAGLAMVGQTQGGCVVNFGDWAEARPY
ncbi:MAG TPA: SDR family NAD(P)-dependent oxidoreductase, partial [Isosphaeraceae bacterium]|nr:SDR family NAD(P)-dependent oxidoreductase [Isosphaeraceae bacterium]